MFDHHHLKIKSSHSHNNEVPGESTTGHYSASSVIVYCNLHMYVLSVRVLSFCCLLCSAVETNDSVGTVKF